MGRISTTFALVLALACEAVVSVVVSAVAGKGYEA
jgi:hypothetical protein